MIDYMGTLTTCRLSSIFLWKKAHKTVIKVNVENIQCMQLTVSLSLTASFS